MSLSRGCTYSRFTISPQNVVFEFYLLIPDADLAKVVSILSSTPGYRQPPPDESEMATNLARQYFLQYWSFRFTNPRSAMFGSAYNSSLPSSLQISPLAREPRLNIVFVYTRSWRSSLSRLCISTFAPLAHGLRWRIGPMSVCTFVIWSTTLLKIVQY
jgi:hypothetical protein